MKPRLGRIQIRYGLWARAELPQIDPESLEIGMTSAGKFRSTVGNGKAISPNLQDLS
jgi:hypothetical protein